MFYSIEALDALLLTHLSLVLHIYISEIYISVKWQPFYPRGAKAITVHNSDSIPMVFNHGCKTSLRLIIRSHSVCQIPCDEKKQTSRYKD